MESEMEMKHRSLCGCAENCDTATRNVQRLKRKKVLEQKKMSDEVIKAAYSHNDHLSPFPSFRHFNRNGVSLYLESGRGNKLSFLVKKYIQNLLKMNMEASYGSQWSAEEKIKHREMVSTQACYIFVYDNDEADPSASNADNAIPIPMVAFLHFRFLVEETIPVLYVYELQIEPRVQGRGLGQFLMELIELIAIKNCMGAVVFTVQKANSKAFNFYQTKLGYTISTISPSRVNSSMTIETSYEILCKAFNEEARVVLEGELSTSNIDGMMKQHVRSEPMKII